MDVTWTKQKRPKVFFRTLVLTAIFPPQFVNTLALITLDLSFDLCIYTRGSFVKTHRNPKGDNDPSPLHCGSSTGSGERTTPWPRRPDQMSVKPASVSAGVSLKAPVLSRSAVGAALLIGLQFSSRAFTFIVNQVLLRYLSPELLGISTQLELYSITVLFFARESLRVAIQRQADTTDDVSKDKERVPKSHVDGRTAAGRSQAIVNIAYISISLGIVFAFGFAWLYLHTTPAQDPTVLETPYIRESLIVYGLVAIWELLAEPCYVIAQQKARFEVRARAESTATVLRCFTTCGSAILASRMGMDIGVLPFALGQSVYALALSIVYYWKIRTISSSNGFSLMATRISR
jgi:oligosaccharide translocation protein RFT1